MTEAEIKQKVMDFLTPLWNHVRNRQDIYFAAKGKYFQGKATSLNPPDDGADVTPDRVATDKPTDQTERWGDVFNVPAQFPCQLIIDAYNGPQGHGFTGTARIRILGQVWERCANEGPETWRAFGWQRLD